MRIRQVKPDFWLDEKMAALTYGARLCYIGLWCAADDAGYLEWNIHRIGAELFPHQTVKRREASIAGWGKELTDSGRLVVLECGHAVIPTLPEHQRLSGPTKRVTTIERKHLSGDCPALPAHPRTSPHIPDTERNGIGTVRNGKERNGSARARGVETTTGETEFQRLVPRPAVAS
jgi:hypothetical protein